MSNPNEIDVNEVTTQFMDTMKEAGYNICILRHSEELGVRFSLGLLDYDGCASDFVSNGIGTLMRIHESFSEGIAQTSDEIFKMAAGGDEEKAEELKAIFAENIRAALSQPELTESQEENQSNN